MGMKWVIVVSCKKKFLLIFLCLWNLLFQLYHLLLSKDFLLYNVYNQFLSCKLFKVDSGFCKMLWVWIVVHSTAVNNHCYYCYYQLILYCIFVLLSTFEILRAFHKSPPKTAIVGALIHKMATGLNIACHTTSIYYKTSSSYIGFCIYHSNVSLIFL